MTKHEITKLFFSIRFFLQTKMRRISIIILIIVFFKSTEQQNVLTKRLGNIAFTERHFTLRKDISIKEFFDNFDVLNKTIKELTSMCEQLKGKNNCKEKIANFEDSVELIRSEINYAKSIMKSRAKRNPAAVVVVGAAFTFKTFFYTALFSFAVSAITAMITTHIVYGVEEEELKASNEALSAHMNLTEKHLAAARDKLTKEITLLKEKREELIKERRYQHAHETASLTILKLFKLSAIFSMIAKDDLKSVFFHVIDINTFEDEIKNVNKKLKSTRELLPYIPIKHLIEMSTLSKTRNDTHFQIYIDIPVISDTHQLVEYIPIPVKIGNETRILNENSKYVYFVNDTSGCILDKKVLDGCVQRYNLSVCSTTSLESLSHPIKCIKNFKYENSLNCSNTRVIESRNYLMETSKTSTYCYIVKPILLRLQCFEKEEIFNLTESREILYESQCKMYRSSRLKKSKNAFSILVPTYEIAIPKFTALNPNLTIFSESIEILNKQKIKISRLIIQTKENSKTFEDKLKSFSNSTILDMLGKPFVMIKDAILEFKDFAFALFCFFIFTMIAIIIGIFIKIIQAIRKCF